ncbi:hypothetical protein ID866_5857 [Astraeus odoratus]|nr:hypothetical protein ID866_5857 [Astraeus odoratus]
MPAMSQSITLAYSLVYDDPKQSLDTLACGTGVDGLELKGYKALGDLPNFPNVGGLDTVMGWNSDGCGMCYNVTYGSTIAHILTVDVALRGFIVSEKAMDALTDGLAARLGRIDVQATAVDATYCGL